MSDGLSSPNTSALRFLFRYRDLVADTLPEHRAVLRGRVASREPVDTIVP
ncbi:hypothetical protein [Micromonospora sonchi]|nr:hypothetical protein [Micromonospora sonchi]